MNEAITIAISALSYLALGLATVFYAYLYRQTKSELDKVKRGRNSQSLIQGSDDVEHEDNAPKHYQANAKKPCVAARVFRKQTPSSNSHHIPENKIPDYSKHCIQHNGDTLPEGQSCVNHNREEPGISRISKR